MASYGGNPRSAPLIIPRTTIRPLPIPSDLSIPHLPPITLPDYSTDSTDPTAPPHSSFLIPHLPFSFSHSHFTFPFLSPHLRLAFTPPPSSPMPISSSYAPHTSGPPGSLLLFVSSHLATPRHPSPPLTDPSQPPPSLHRFSPPQPVPSYLAAPATPPP